MRKAPTPDTSALLAYAGEEKRIAPARPENRATGRVDSALRFAQAFPDDPRAGAFVRAAEKLYVLHDPDRALAVAQQVVALKAPRRGRANGCGLDRDRAPSFERAAFDRAERAYW